MEDCLYQLATTEDEVSTDNLQSKHARGAILYEVVVQGWFHEFEPESRDKRVKYKNPILFKMKTPDKGKRWLLGYYHNRNKNRIYGWTGPFRSKAEAIHWYNAGGR